MAVPNRGTGSCDQAVSALEAALEVHALPFYVYGVPNSCLKRCTEYLYIQTLHPYVLQAGLLWRRVVIVQISTIYIRSAACVPPITCVSTLHYDIGVPETCT
jgi:hypothetical protein